MPQHRILEMNKYLVACFFIFVFFINILFAGCMDSDCARKLANADSTWCELLPDNTVLDEDMVDKYDVYINYPFLYCKVVSDSIFKIRIPNLVRSNVKMEIAFCWRCIDEGNSLGSMGMACKTFSLSIPRGKFGSYSITAAHPCATVMDTTFRWIMNFQVNMYKRY